ncbi:MAG: hypothetical protein PHO61_03570 [Candidatus ainarchaeum sp.]|jgi:hypothetical protein|nr:hypothetical protein [Candidatus ainarchaeum sp.]MDD3086306.1 hypothetical protein [Candidatus ainarchaeum sp.]HPM86142.1 hypothetical protein [archaeon]
MEERIISYESNDKIQEIVLMMHSQNFLLTEHKTTTKQLYFKKFNKLPQTKPFGE